MVFVNTIPNINNIYIYIERVDFNEKQRFIYKFVIYTRLLKKYNKKPFKVLTILISKGIM